MVEAIGLPKSGVSQAPHSPLAAGFIRAQSGTKSRSASFQLRAVERGNRVPCAGLFSV